MSNTLWLVVVGSAVVVGFLAKHYHAKITGFFLTLKADLARVETMLGAHHDAVAQEVNAATKPAQVQQTFMGMPLREPISNSGFVTPPVQPEALPSVPQILAHLNDTPSTSSSQGEADVK